MSGPRHVPTPARDAALDKAWAEHPELGDEERGAFIYGFEAGWNAAAPRLAAALKQLLDYTLACELIVYDVEEQHNEHPVVAAARAALREAGVES